METIDDNRPKKDDNFLKEGDKLPKEDDNLSAIAAELPILVSPEQGLW